MLLTARNVVGLLFAYAISLSVARAQCPCELMRGAE